MPSSRASLAKALLALVAVFVITRCDLYRSLPIFRTPTSSSASDIRTVHVIFSNHLDVGFHSYVNDKKGTPLPGTDNTVISHYFRDYFPAAIATANALRDSQGPMQYSYLTHSWLVSLYLDCPQALNIYCPSETELTAFKAAVLRGDVTWHAMPHNAELEFFQHPEFLHWAIDGLTHTLDRQFNLPLKKVMSQRDVPGFTRAALPILAAAGVQGISVGVNGGSAPPDVPLNTPFWWKDPHSGAKLLAFWHAGGYSGVPVDSTEECVSLPGFDQVLCSAWRGDNEGPHSPQEVVEIYTQLKKQFPSAEKIVSSSLDNFVDAVIMTHASSNTKLDLPVVTAEIGDTWIHGIASDPVKVSDYRALLRVWRRWYKKYHHAGTTTAEEENTATATATATATVLKATSQTLIDNKGLLDTFAKLLVKIPEHTWGVDTKQYPGDYENWSNTDFQQALVSDDGGRFAAAIQSWQRQRAYNYWAVDELGDSSEVGQEARRVLKKLQKERNQTPFSSSSLHGGGGRFVEIPLSAATKRASASSDNHRNLEFQSGNWKLKIDEDTGALSSLIYLSPTDATASATASTFSSHHHRTSIDWVGKDGTLAQLLYSTYDESSFDTIWQDYAYRPTSPLPDWFYKDFGKPGASTLGGARRRDSKAQLRRLWQRIDNSSNNNNNDSLHIVAEVGFDEELVRDAGAPAVVYLEYQVLSPSSPSPPSSASASSDADATDTVNSKHNSDALLIDITWINKTATRLPEALWLTWRPGSNSRSEVNNLDSWKLSKLGSFISPMEVLKNGSMGLHAVDDHGVVVQAYPVQSSSSSLEYSALDSVPQKTSSENNDKGDTTADFNIKNKQIVSSSSSSDSDSDSSPSKPTPTKQLRIVSWDASLVCAGTPTPFPVVKQLPDMSQGVSTLLVNNIWGTNYPMWFPYDDQGKNMKFRFQVTVEDVLEEQEGSLAVE